MTLCARDWDVPLLSADKVVFKDARSLIADFEVAQNRLDKTFESDVNQKSSTVVGEINYLACHQSIWYNIDVLINLATVLR